ncbi:CTP synthase [Anaerocaecibacter muris]|uniref:CTP synthase n=1 Tax=Anaerocaecibacter muris TaxID=2941513 RepID=UPI00203FBC6B|nr:CTP synthase [Anaerocaecibacter muris]
MEKYIFVTGGVVSGLGKGITAASLGLILKSKGLKVIAQKLDPYINVDPGTMSPYQHGEVFVTEDGAETDLDLGHYERFIDENLNKFSNLTTGKVYSTVLQNERDGVYNGETVQVIPHITNQIKKFIYSVGKKIEADVVITEIGGTVGDIESLPFIEAIRQVSNDVGRENCLFVHVTLAPTLTSNGEVKTKPTQHSVKTLRSLGISPNLVVLRTSKPIDDKLKEKLAMSCNVEPDCVIENRDADLLYEVPLLLLDSGIGDIVTRELNLPDNPPQLDDWRAMVEMAKKREGVVTIALVGKYVQMFDAYLSVVEALTHGGIHNGVKIDLKWIDAERLTDSTVASYLDGADGVIVPGGFGDRGIEGMVTAAKYCRENNKPYFGICLGMQIAVIEFARNVLGYADATSREFDPASAHKVIDIMEDQIGCENTGGTMRLGAYECMITPNSTLARCYGEGVTSVWERHRHRYEFNNAIREDAQNAGLTLCGISPDGNLVEAVEVTDNLFHLGVQYHPEFKSRPARPQPIFREFIAAAKKYATARKPAKKSK